MKMETLGSHFCYDFWDPFQGIPMQLSAHHRYTQRISCCHEFLDANIAHNARRSQWLARNSYRMHFDHGLAQRR